MDLNKKLEELKPYQLNCNVFDVYSYNGLTMQDLLCQFFTKINECITVSNETIDLAKWLVNEGLEIEVAKKLVMWLEDGTLENIINVNLFNTLNEKINGLSSQLEHNENKIDLLSYATVKNENELIKALSENVKSIRLISDIILTQPVMLNNVRLNLNNFTVFLSDDFRGDHIFSIGYGDDISTQLGHNRKSQHIINGYIDCNDKLVTVVKFYFSWDFKCSNLRIERCGKGFISYYDESLELEAIGCEMCLNNISIVHSDKYTNESIGFEIRTTDTHITDCYTQYFKYGFVNYGSNNYYNTCHAWGLPLGGKLSKRMAIGFVNKKSNVTFTNCTSDSFELFNEKLEASLSNGGIGFYSYGVSVRFIGCYGLTHHASKDNTLIPFWIEDIVDGAYSMSNDVYITNCVVPRNDGTNIKKAVYYNGNDGLTLLGCNFDLNSVNTHTNIINSDKTIFNNDKKGVTHLNENNTFKFNIYTDMLACYHKNDNGEMNYYKFRPNIYDIYDKDQLISLKSKLIQQDEISNGGVGVTLVIFKTSSTTYELVMWVRSERAFYYVRTGEKVVFV